jgi:PTH1 family peptidyl-tRNA hydrolase
VAIKLVVGLGNPGPKYRGTRHNIGFAVVDELARRAGVAFEVGPVDALVARIRPQGGGDPVLLAKPLTFMNLSGEAVGALMRYYKIAPIDLLVIVDEAQLPLARLRARARGSSGGHNGLRSVAQHLGDDYARLRVGVGRGDARRDLADHVLARFERDEMVDVDAMTARAADAAETFLADGIDAVMNRFNAPEDRSSGDETGKS